MPRKLIEFQYECPTEKTEQPVILIEDVDCRRSAAYMRLQLQCKTCGNVFQPEALKERNDSKYRAEASDIHR